MEKQKAEIENKLLFFKKKKKCIDNAITALKPPLDILK